MQLFSYFRSSAAYRVRIALNVKQLEADYRPVHLVRDGGEQHTLKFRKLNPQRRIPVLVDGGIPITQSMAILEYLEEIHPNPPLLPDDAADRAWVRSLAHVVAADIHPLNNVSVLKFLEKEFGVDEGGRRKWIHRWITQGFSALEEILAKDPRVKTYCYGDRITMADICLVPQVYNAIRFGVDLAPYPAIRRVNEACLKLQAFQDAAPEKQPDAE